MSDDETYTTVLVLKSGARVRAGETLEYVEAWMQTPRPSGLIEVSDPGDDRKKLVPVGEVDFVEVEPQ